MKPKLKDLNNVVIDCGTNERLKDVVKDHIWANIAVPTKGQGIYGISEYDTLLKLNGKTWETVSNISTTPTNHINDIEL